MCKKVLTVISSISLTILCLLGPFSVPVKAVSAVSKTLTHYYLSISQDNIYSTQSGSTTDYLVISWSPKSDDDLDYVTRATITITLASGGSEQYRLYLYGVDSIMIPSLNNDTNITSSNVSVAEVQYSLTSDTSTLIDILAGINSQNAYIDDIETLISTTNSYLVYMNSHLTNIDNGTVPQYDIPLYSVPIYSYFAYNGGIAQVQAHQANFFVGQSAWFNDYMVLKGYNNPTSGDSGYLTAYADEDYIFVFGLNTSTQMVQEGRMTLNYRSGGYSTFEITRRTQKSHGQSLHISAFIGHSAKDGTNSNNSAFTLNFTVNRFADYQYIPIYWGMTKYCPEEVWDLLQMDNPELEEDKNKIDEFADTVSDLTAIEDDYNDSFNDAVDDIDVDFNYSTDFGQSFLNSGTWVVTQFNRFINNNPIGTFLKFSLIVGVAMLIIGKKNK